MSRKTCLSSLRLAGLGVLLVLAWPLQAGEWDLGDSAIAQLESFHEGLAAFKMNGRWGFVDRNGKLAVEPQFDEVRAFSEGLAAVSKDEQWGFIDRTGKLRIPLGYIYVHDFHQGLAGAKSEQDKFGYLAPDGQWAVPPRFENGDDFQQGHALVVEHTNRYRLIDVRGNVIKEFAPEYRVSDREGFLIVTRQPLPVRVSRDGQISPLPEEAGRKSAALQVLPELIDDHLLYGAKDDEGRWVIAPTFERLHAFRDGLAIAGSEVALGLVDPTGKFVVPPSYKEIEEIAGGRYLAHVENPSAQRVVFDRQGRQIFSSACAQLEQKLLGPWTVFEGCDAVWVLGRDERLYRLDFQQPEIARVGDYLLIQSMAGKLVDGRLMTPFTLLGPQGIVLSSEMPEIGRNYDWAMLIDGSDKVSTDVTRLLPVALLASRDGGVAIVTRDHRVVHQPAWRYDDTLLDYGPSAGNLNGPMIMKTASTWGAVDAQGEWVLPPGFEKLHPFSGDTAQAILDGRDVVYGRSGRHRELPAGFRFAENLGGERFVLEGRNEAGEKQRIEHDLATGEERSYVVDRRFDADARGRLVPAYEDGKYGLIDIEGKWIVPPVYESRPDALMWNTQLLGWKTYIYDKEDGSGGQSLYGLLSPEGKEIVKPRYASITTHEPSGLLEITDRHTRQQGLMRADGREILPAEYRNIIYRDDGTFEAEPEELKGLMNMQGEWLLEPGRYDFNGFGSAPYSRERVGGEDAYIDTAGRISTPSRPLAALNDNPDDWTRREEKDKSGRTVSVFYGFDWKPRLRLPEGATGGFSGGVLGFREYLQGHDRMRLVDSHGRIVTLNYDAVGRMSEGLLVASKGGNEARARHGYIDRQGRTRIAPIYERAEDFSEGRAVVVLKGNYGIIDTQGKLILHSAWLCGQYPVLIDAQQKVLWPATSLGDCNRPAVKH